MMAKYRPHLLILISLALAALVWLDNRNLLFPEKDVAVVSRANDSAHALETDKKQSSGSEPASTTHAANPLLSGNPLASFDKASLANWVDRPLFAPSRKGPPPQEEAKSVAKPKPPPDYQLLGVVLNRKHPIALLRSEGSGADFRVEVGDMIGGWYVAAVEWESVTLKRDDASSQTVRFKKDCAGSDGTACP
jgi:general secretion pathway protein N